MHGSAVAHRGRGVRHRHGRSRFHGAGGGTLASGHGHGRGRVRAAGAYGLAASDGLLGILRAALLFEAGLALLLDGCLVLRLAVASDVDAALRGKATESGGKARGL